MKKETDYKTLIPRAQAGDQDAWTQLIEVTEKQAGFIASGFFKSKEDVEDAVQESYIKVVQRIGSLQEPEKFPGWLKQVVTNTCIDMKRKRRDFTFSDVESNPDVEDNLQFEIEDLRVDYKPEEQMDIQETSRLIKGMMDELPEEQRVTLNLLYGSEMSVKEIAEAMEVSENTVKSRLRYGRMAMEEKVEDLRKKGTKLYVAPIGFLLYTVLHNDMESYAASNRFRLSQSKKLDQVLDEIKHGRNVSDNTGSLQADKGRELFNVKEPTPEEWEKIKQDYRMAQANKAVRTQSTTDNTPVQQGTEHDYSSQSSNGVGVSDKTVSMNKPENTKKNGQGLAENTKTDTSSHKDKETIATAVNAKAAKNKPKMGFVIGGAVAVAIVGATVAVATIRRTDYAPATQAIVESSAELQADFTESIKPSESILETEAPLPQTEIIYDENGEPTNVYLTGLDSLGTEKISLSVKENEEEDKAVLIKGHLINNNEVYADKIKQAGENLFEELKHPKGDKYLVNSSYALSVDSDMDIREAEIVWENDLNWATVKERYSDPYRNTYMFRGYFQERDSTDEITLEGNEYRLHLNGNYVFHVQDIAETDTELAEITGMLVYPNEVFPEISSALNKTFSSLLMENGIQITNSELTTYAALEYAGDVDTAQIPSAGSPCHFKGFLTKREVSDIEGPNEEGQYIWHPWGEYVFTVTEILDK